MSGSIQGTGSQPVNFDAPSIGETGETSKTVSSGLIGNDAKLQMMQSKKAITNSQLAHRPTLLQPKEMGMQAQASANQAASSDLTGLGKMTEAASSKVAMAMVRAQLGMQAPEDQAMFQKHATVLGKGADYIDSLFKGKGEFTKNEKANILGGQGFDDQQIEDLLLSQSDRAAFKTKIQQKHGNTYNQKLADLKAMGYDEHQADMLLVLGDDNIMKNDNRKAELNRIFKDNGKAQNLAKMGFNEQQIKSLLNIEQRTQNQTKARAASSDLAKLNQKMGFSEREAKTMLATAQSEKLNEQASMMKRMQRNPSEVSNKMRTLSQNAQTMANSPLKPYLEEHLKQQADIFMVLELIHEMSVKQRRFGREMRQLEYESARQETLKQAEHIREAAKYQLASAIAGGAMSIVGGMMSMGAGFKGAGGSKKSAGGKKGKGVAPDDVKISQGKAKGTNKPGADGTENNSNTTKTKSKKDQAKQADADADKEITNTKRQEATEQKQQESAEQQSVNKQEQRSDSQSDVQQTEAQTKQQTKKEVEAEQKQADNQTRDQQAADAAQDQQKAAAEAQGNITGRKDLAGTSGRKKGRAASSAPERKPISFRSKEETANLIQGSRVRALEKGKGQGISKGMENTLNGSAKPAKWRNAADDFEFQTNKAQADSGGTKKAKKNKGDADSKTVGKDTQTVRDPAETQTQKNKTLKDTNEKAKQAQEQKAENNQEAQQAAADHQAQKKQQATKDQDQDAEAVNKHQSDSQSDAQGAETDLNNQQNKQETADQNKDAEDVESAEKSKSESAESKQEQDMEEQQQLSSLQANAQAINSLFNGLGQVAAGGFNFLATEHQALQKESEARQKTHENAAQAWSEWMQLHQDQVKNCQSKIDEINRIHFDTLKSLSRG